MPVIVAQLLGAVGAAAGAAFVKMLMAAATDKLIMRIVYEGVKYLGEKTETPVDNPIIREWGVNMGFEKPLPEKAPDAPIYPAEDDSR